MKKLLALVLSLFLAASLCACSAAINEQQTPATTEPIQDVKAKVTTAEGVEYLTAKELCDIDSSNAIKFDNVYWCASVTVTGTVKKIEGPITINGTRYNWALYVEGGQADWFIGDTQYNTSMVSDDVLARLNVGDTVEITGEIVGTSSWGECDISNGMIFVVPK